MELTTRILLTNMKNFVGRYKTENKDATRAENPTDAKQSIDVQKVREIASDAIDDNYQYNRNIAR